jgi:hypothetical protein
VRQHHCPERAKSRGRASAAHYLRQNNNRFVAFGKALVGGMGEA